MAKNIKDIVDEGFSKLASLAEKRMEILGRCAQISNAASGPEFEAAEQKVKAAESAYVEEINTQVEQLLSELRQTLSQVSDNSRFLQGSTKEKLTLHVSGVIAELKQSQSYLLKGATERLDSLFLQVDKELKSEEEILSSESLRQLAELDILLNRSQTSLIQAQSDSAGKLAHKQHELRGILAEACNSIILGVEKKRHKAKDKLEKFSRGQVDDLSQATAGMEKQVDGFVAKSLEEMKAACIKMERELEHKRELMLSDAVSELKALSKEALAQLEDSYDNSRKELSEKLTAVLELTKKLLQQEQQSLSELDSGLKGSADAICTEVMTGGADASAGVIKRNPVEEAFAKAADEFNDVADELNRNVKDLLKAQADGMAKLCTAAEASFLDLFSDFMSQMKESLKEQEQLCIKKEEELVGQLEKLEKQIIETRAELNGAGASGES